MGYSDTHESLPCKGGALPWVTLVLETGIRNQENSETDWFSRLLPVELSTYPIVHSSTLLGLSVAVKYSVVIAGLSGSEAAVRLDGLELLGSV